MSEDRLKGLHAYQCGWVKGRCGCWKSDPGLENCMAQEYVLRIHDIRRVMPMRGPKMAHRLGRFPMSAKG